MSFTPLVSERHKHFVKSKPSSGDQHKFTRAVEDSEVVKDDNNSPYRVGKQPKKGRDSDKGRGRMPERAAAKEDPGSSDGRIRLGSDDSSASFSRSALEENPASPAMPGQLFQVSPSRRLLLEEEESLIPGEFSRR